MVASNRLSDREIWDRLMKKFGKTLFQFRDVAALSEPERAFEFMQRADDEGWVQGDDDGDKFELVPGVEPEETAKRSRDAPRGSPKAGEEFDEWYRGVKFRLSASGSISWASPRKVVNIQVTAGFEGVIDKLRAVRPTGGSFRVDELGRVLVKDPDREYVVVSLGNLRKKIQLDGIERDPRDRVKPGWIWPSIFDGAKYHISPDGEVWFRNPGGTRRYAESGHESLVEPLRKLKSKGGSFRITETGRVLTLLYTLPLPEEARAQWERMTDEERRIIQARESPGQPLLIPIFVTDFQGKIRLKEPFDIHEPWTDKERDEFFQVLASRGGGEP